MDAEQLAREDIERCMTQLEVATAEILSLQKIAARAARILEREYGITVPSAPPSRLFTDIQTWQAVLILLRLRGSWIPRTSLEAELLEKGAAEETSRPAVEITKSIDKLLSGENPKIVADGDVIGLPEWQKWE